MFGIRGISLGSLLLILAVVVLIFGTKRLRHIGEDVGAAIKNFRRGLADDNKKRDE
jgi:sec-independent protein translocase protein TatA